MISRLRLAALMLLTPLACGDSGDTTTEGGSTTQATQATTTEASSGTDTAGPTTAGSESDGSDGSSDSSSTTPVTDGSDPTDATEETSSSDTETATTDDPCACQVGELCEDGECVPACQTVDPDPCGPDQVCDILSGECTDPETPCTLSGPSIQCGDVSCGPGTACDDQGACVPLSPCATVECEGDVCWGGSCSCTRTHECPQAPDEALLNGPFSSFLMGLDFADDCTAWMVTLQDGTDYLRRLRPDGELTEWPGVSNLDMGEVKVLKPLTVIAAGAGPEQEAAQPQPSAVEGLGEVALTYTCCEMCGCFADDPQGVARLDEASMQTPLPFVIIATITDGDGPFGHIVADAGPQGLTWGEDRVLYVGNSTQNGELNSADLELMTQEVLTPLPERIHAAAAVSPVHLLVAVEGGDVYRYNTEVGAATFLVALGSDVTALAHDAFTGLVHASLQNLEIVTVHPFSGEVTPFDVMPAIGRVAVSPNGQLWYAPAKYIAGNLPLTAWSLPSEF